ncbi:unnamed protein product, partial [Discosporangium mesarthrocarpum]
MAILSLQQSMASSIQEALGPNPQSQEAQEPSIQPRSGYSRDKQGERGRTEGGVGDGDCGDDHERQTKPWGIGTRPQGRSGRATKRKPGGGSRGRGGSRSARGGKSTAHKQGRGQGQAPQGRKVSYLWRDALLECAVCQGRMSPSSGHVYLPMGPLGNTSMGWQAALVASQHPLKRSVRAGAGGRARAGAGAGQGERELAIARRRATRGDSARRRRREKRTPSDFAESLALRGDLSSPPSPHPHRTSGMSPAPASTPAPISAPAPASATGPRVGGRFQHRYVFLTPSEAGARVRVRTAPGREEKGLHPPGGGRSGSKCDRDGEDQRRRHRQGWPPPRALLLLREDFVCEGRENEEVEEEEVAEEGEGEEKRGVA